MLSPRLDRRVCLLSSPLLRPLSFRSCLPNSGSNQETVVLPNSIWFHCASTGETRSVAPLARALDERLGHRYPVLFTNRSSRALQWPVPGVDDQNTRRFARVLGPSELRVGGFLAQSKPIAAVFVESELWPVLIHRARRCIQGPMVLVNARMSEKSFGRWMSSPLSRAVVRSMVTAFDAIHAQSDADADRFRALGWNNKPMLIGSLKLASIRTAPTALRTSNIDSAVSELLSSLTPGWAAVSIHPNEEEVILEAQKLLPNPKPRLILVPRHPSLNSPKIVQVAESVYVVNAMNIVEDVCAWASRGKAMVFVGGSLTRSKHHGGHNILEPLSRGCRVLHGPHMGSFEHLIKNIPLGKARFSVDSAQEFVSHLMASSSSPLLLNVQTSLLDQFLNDGDRILKEVADMIEEMIRARIRV